MSTSPTRVRAEPQALAVPALDCRRTTDDAGDEEVTFFEPDRDPEERTTRWITVHESDLLPEDEWR